MKYVSKLKNFLKKLKLYTAGTILVVSTGAAALVGCTKKTNVTKEPTNTVTEMPTPTDEVTITVTPTPTNTPTPTSTPTPTPAPVLEKITVDDILKRDVIFCNYFGELEDVDTEMAKRKEYLKSFNALSEEKINVVLSNYNLCYLTGDLVDHDKAQKYLDYCTEKNLSILASAQDEIAIYNANHLDDQIYLPYLGAGDAFSDEDKIRLANVQYNTCKMMAEDISYRSFLNPNPPFNCTVIENDGRTTRQYISLDDLGSVIKYAGLAYPFGELTRLQKQDSWFQYINLRNDLEDIQPRLLDVDRIRIDVMGYSTIEYDEIRR